MDANGMMKGISRGTKMYKAPEVLNNSMAGCASDWFSFGMLVQVMITGVEFHKVAEADEWNKAMRALPEDYDVDWALEGLLYWDPIKRADFEDVKHFEIFKMPEITWDSRMAHQQPPLSPALLRANKKKSRFEGRRLSDILERLERKSAEEEEYFLKNFSAARKDLAERIKNMAESQVSL